MIAATQLRLVLVTPETTLVDTPTTSIVVPLYNEAENIASAVQDFAGQSTVDEVVVVDNNSRDDTAVLATSAFYISNLHELRVYTLMVLMTCVILWSYWRIIAADKRRSNPRPG